MPGDFKAKTQNLTKRDWIIFDTLVKALCELISTLLKIELFVCVGGHRIQISLLSTETTDTGLT